MNQNRTIKQRSSRNRIGFQWGRGLGASAWRLPALVAIVALFGWAGCSDDDDNGVTMPTVGSASLRAAHLSFDAPAVDIFLNEGQAAAVTALAFEEGTPYLVVDEGTYKLDLAASGSGWQQAVLSVSGLELGADQSYTAVAYGELNSIQALALLDDLSTPPAGELRLRAVHTAFGVGEVDIWNITDAQNPGLLYEDVGYGAVGSYYELPAQAYTLGFDLDNDASPDVTFDVPALPAGTIANVFAVRNVGGDVFLIAQLQDGTLAKINAS